jgi:hypothetical protein
MMDLFNSITDVATCGECPANYDELSAWTSDALNHSAHLDLLSNPFFLGNSPLVSLQEPDRTSGIAFATTVS